MRVRVIGIGAAGNKAAISLIENGIVLKEKVTLLNSTFRDIPVNYRDVAIQFTESCGGCGKERSIAKESMINALRSSKLNLDALLDPEDEMVIIVNSSEGGTGCGASSIVAKYFKNVLDVPVHMFVFTGFEEDTRGLINTLEYFKELQESYTVEVLSNKKFLDETGNKPRAEKLANEEFTMKIRILLGQCIVDSAQNIDETDLRKLSLTPGFMIIERAELGKIKNIQMFNELCASMIDSTKSLDFTPSAKRIGIILNVNDKTKDYIDYTFRVIKDKCGRPFEIFTHIQTEPGAEYIAIIASGINMPIEDVKSIYNKYIEESNKVLMAKDDFYSKAGEFIDNTASAMFNMGSTITHNAKAPSDADKMAFFEEVLVDKYNKDNNISNINIKKPRAPIITIGSSNEVKEKY